MIIRPGEKIHVVFRRLYEKDARRHFAGTVVECEGSFVRAEGYLFAEAVRLNSVVDFVKIGTMRARIIPLDAGTVFVNILPPAVDIEKLHYKYEHAGEIRLTDGTDWHLDLSQL